MSLPPLCHPLRWLSSFLSPINPWRVPMHCIVIGLVSEYLLPCRSISVYRWRQGTSLVILWELRSSLGVFSLINKGIQEWAQTEAPGYFY